MNRNIAQKNRLLRTLSLLRNLWDDSEGIEGCPRWDLNDVAAEQLEGLPHGLLRRRLTADEKRPRGLSEEPGPKRLQAGKLGWETAPSPRPSLI